MNETGLRRMRKTVGSVYDTERRTDVHMPGMRTAQTLRSVAHASRRADNKTAHLGKVQRIRRLRPQDHKRQEGESQNDSSATKIHHKA